MPEKDLYDAIRDGDFYPKSSCPRKPVKPRLIGQHTSKEAEIYVEALKEYENDMVNWNDMESAWRAEYRDLQAKFKALAFGYCGINEHPKRERAWSMAWDHGHSSGLNDVLHHLEELSELLI